MNIFGKWKYIGLGGKGKYGLSVGQIKRIVRDFLISAIDFSSGWFKQSGLHSS